MIARDVSTAAATVQLAAAGDTVAFARIVTAYHADMIRVAYVVSGGRQDIADDAVQSAWSVAWRKLGSL
ncbi:MAG: RNA polymerase sigma factor, partial [Candidatus Limnocylindrales bacterium]